ncbi:MAG TPA: TIM barrel protein [Devosia sp.]|uniref:TIM barrel protein n=1 Tax=Devosia sp. TaxID=1871048 RepID=UPI002DDD1006|nr:TIM barrel protein [Devosia sp.]HEV2517318.1 TIM barrel protein [Devosia sp.]
MIDFSVSIELAFGEGGRSFPDRVRAAAAAGFTAVEIWDWRDKPLAQLGAALRDTGTKLETLCVEDWRDKCQLAAPAEHAEFVRRVLETARVAVELGCPKLVVLAGDRIAGVALEAQLAAAHDALAQASDAIAGLPVELLVEVVNREFEGPNALLQDSLSALTLLRRLGRPNLRFLYDRYHAILNGEPRGWAIEGNMSLVGHIQAADLPGRHEFGAGTHDWAAELCWLEQAGYAGYIGIEATPLGPSEALYEGATAVLRRAIRQGAG